MLPIEFLILYPISIPPYEFERDAYVEGFNDATEHWKQEVKRMYRGGQL